MDLLKASFSQITKEILQKKISAVEVTDFFLKRIDKYNSKMNAFVHLDQSAKQQAIEIDQKIARQENPGLLAGIPWGIKDMFCTKGLPSTAASKILSGFVPPYDATVVERLKKNGSVILGKLNQDEFAMGSSSENSFFGATKNPWNLEYTAGGSSGGSAAAQSARLCAGATGTDTGGSIRQPANFCGIVGVKPTYGRISRFGIISYASSLDQAGPMTSCVEDAALSLEVMCGHDPQDSTCSNKQVPQFSKNLSLNMKGLKIGIIQEYMKGGLSPAVEKTLLTAKAELQKAGAEFVEISIPLTEQAIPMYYLISASEASSNLARYDGVKYGYRAEFKNLSAISLDEFYMKTRGEGFGKEVKRRIMLGTYCLSSGYYEAYYNKACQVRRMMKDQFVAAFQKCDVILSPVTTSAAFKLGERISDPLSMYLNDIFTVSTNLVGLPGMSVPYGISENNLPIGVQLTASHFEEQKMLNVGFFLESTTSETWRLPDVERL